MSNRMKYLFPEGAEMPSGEFLGFIDDAVQLLLLADEWNDEFLSGNDEGYVLINIGIFSRWTFLSTCIALEASANKIIQSLSLPQKLFDAIEKLSPIEKYEFYAFHNNKDNSIFRSSHFIRDIKCIFQARNRYVHPKSKPIHKKTCEKNGIEFNAKNDSLNLPSQFQMITYENARDSLNTVLKFLSWFFLDYCSLSQKEALMLLADVISYDGGHFINAKGKFSFDFRLFHNDNIVIHTVPDE